MDSTPARGGGQDPTANAPPLLTHHLRQLRDESGIPEDVIAEREYRSVTDPAELRRLGFKQTGLTVPGLVMPLWGPDGSNGRYVYRPDLPRHSKAGKPLKYEMPKGERARLDVPPRCRPAIRRSDAPLYVVEGLKKADALAAAGRCAVAVLGVWMWRGTNEHGAITTLPEWHEIALKGRTVYIVFDSDVSEKPGVYQAMTALRAWLKTKGAEVRALRLPPGPDGKKVGVDDFLLTGAIADLDALAAEPEPAPPVALEWLDTPPPTLSRPLDLVDGRAYAATWVHVRRTEYDEETGRPRTTTRQELIVVRADGRVFGPGGAPLDELGIEIRLPYPVRERHVWRVPAVRAFRDGVRPAAGGVFRRLADVFDYFLDFPGQGSGLAGQRETCELSACLSIVTWLTSATTVVGYPWPNGPTGSGKTKWAYIWSRTGFCGELILSSGSFASIRDLVDYGGALAFDDAETLADPKKCDPAIRELLLAGHHAGAVLTVKEPGPDKTWSTRFVNTFAPRAFTAIKLPDPVLASRSLLIPLVRTASEKANREPAEIARWPHDQRQLQDDLYALALTLLPQAPAVWTELEHETGTVGRDFEPWRPVLMVARLLERAGVAGLEGRMKTIMAGYGEEKADLIPPDRSILVLRALLHLIPAAASDTNDTKTTNDTTLGEAAAAIHTSSPQPAEFSASEVAKEVKRQAEEEGVEDTEWINGTWVGRALTGLRFKRLRSGKRRFFRIPPDQLRETARAYGLLRPTNDTTRPTNEESPPPEVSVISVGSVISVTPSAAPNDPPEAACSLCGAVPAPHTWDLQPCCVDCYQQRRKRVA